MQKIQFDYFTGMEAEQYSFYRVPKVLFTESCFKTLSCEAKVLYGLMLDRMSLSIKNRWLDSEDRVYIIFTVEEIAELMNCGTQKAVKLVKELDSSNGIGLIEKKRLGLGKPNVIYVKNFIIREVPDQKPTGNCANLQSEQEDHKKNADLQSKQERHKECADLQQEAENKGKTGISLNCENHHSGVVKTTIQDYGESQFQNSENHNSRMVETTNPESPESQFQNSENHHSRIVEITNPECPKSQSNNTDINKTDISETEINQSYPITSGNSKRKKDVMEEMRAYREVIHENIDYQYHAKEDVDELVELIIEVMMMPEDSMIRIAGVEKPVALVKSRFMKLNYSHIEYVLFCLNRNTTKVGNIKAYLLTALYNAPATINSYYQAEVNHDMYGGYRNMKKMIKKVIAPVLVITVLFAVLRPFCIQDGECNYFLLLLLMGIPFGIGKMCVWMVPRGFDLGGTLAVWTMNLLIGGLIGSIILLAMVGQAIIYLCVFLITLLTGIHKIPRIK